MTESSPHLQRFLFLKDGVESQIRELESRIRDYGGGLGECPTPPLKWIQALGSLRRELTALEGDIERLRDRSGYGR